jgi:tetratricopeptide (TPR) repeat protein
VDELRPVVKKFFEKGVSAVQRAIAIEPNSARGYSDLGVVAWTDGKPLEAAAYFDKALATDPYSAGALDLYAVLLSNAGHIKEALAMNTQARLLEPFLPAPARDQVNYLWLSRSSRIGLGV